VLAISQQAIDHPRMQKILIAHGLVQTNATLVQGQLQPSYLAGCPCDI